MNEFILISIALSQQVLFANMQASAAIAVSNCTKFHSAYGLDNGFPILSQYVEHVTIPPQHIIKVAQWRQFHVCQVII